MKNIFCTILLVVIFNVLYAQTNPVPVNFNLSTTDDYKAFENDFKNCIDWLLQKPLTDDRKTRMQVNEFVLKWLSGCPYLNVEINTDIIQPILDEPKFDHAADFMMIYAAGMAKCALENSKSTELQNQMAGVEAMLSIYEKIIPAKSSASLEQFIKLQKKDKLENWVKARL